MKIVVLDSFRVMLPSLKQIMNYKMFSKLKKVSYTHTHTHTYIYIYTYTHKNTYVPIFTYTHPHTQGL